MIFYDYKVLLYIMYYIKNFDILSSFYLAKKRYLSSFSIPATDFNYLTFMTFRCGLTDTPKSHFSIS